MFLCPIMKESPGTESAIEDTVNIWGHIFKSKLPVMQMVSGRASNQTLWSACGEFDRLVTVTLGRETMLPSRHHWWEVLQHPCLQPTLTAVTALGWVCTVTFPTGRHLRHQPQRHSILDSSADSEQPAQPEEEMRAEEWGSDLVFLPPFLD